MVRTRFHQIAPIGTVLLSLILAAGCANGRQGSATLDCHPASAPCPAITQTADITSFAAVEQAPEVMAADVRSRAAAEEINKARALRRPDGSFIAAAGVDSEYDGGSSRLRTGGNYAYAAGIDLPLYQGGRPQAALQAAEAGLRASRHVADDRRVATTYELAISLLRIRQQSDLIAAFHRQRKTLVLLRNELAAELSAGFASRVDIDDTDRQIARIDVLLDVAKIAVAEASRTTNRLNVSPSAQPPNISSLDLDRSQQALIAIALANNPRIAESAARIDQSAARVVEAKGEMLPSVSARMEVFGEDSELPGVESATGGRAEVRLAVPFNLNGAGSATVRQRTEETRAARLDNDAARGGVVAAVRSAFERRERARQMLSSAKAEMRSAKSMLVGVRAERQVGERSTFDEIRAIENLTAAEANLNIALFELKASEYTLAAETGLLASLVGETVTAMATE